MLSPVAQIVKTYGSEGEVLVRVSSPEFGSYLEDFMPEDNNEPVFIHFEGIPVPFYIRSARRRSGNAYIVVFTTVSDAKRAEETVGRHLYVGEGLSGGALLQEGCDYSSLEDFSVLAGFTLTDQNGLAVGLVEDVIEYPANICLEVRRPDGGETVLVPLHDDLILDFSAERRSIKLRIADGLL